MKRIIKIVLGAIFLVYGPLQSLSFGQSSANYQVIHWGISSSAGTLNSSSFLLKESALGVFSQGASSSTNFLLDGGMIITDIDNLHQKTSNSPETFTLKQNFPNPFNPRTTIEYDIPEPLKVSILIYNNLGHIIKTYNQGLQPSGHYQIIWDGRNEEGERVSSGVYYYKIIANENVSVKKMMLIK